MNNSHTSHIQIERKEVSIEIKDKVKKAIISLRNGRMCGSEN